jgi:hypothetical protein
VCIPKQFIHSHALAHTAPKIRALLNAHKRVVLRTVVLRTVGLRMVYLDFVGA